jgi:hypothetical protein
MLASRNTFMDSGFDFQSFTGLLLFVLDKALVSKGISSTQGIV